MSILTELKRRNVFRVAAAYLVIAWLIVQVISILSPMFEVPVSFQRGVVLILLVAFIPVLFFTWAYEITEDGIKKETEIERDASLTAHTAKKLNYITIAAAFGVLGLFVFQQLNPYSSNTELTIESAESQTELIKNQTNPPSSVPTNTMNTALALGVAVLPFANLSEDPNNAFFAGGVHEDVLTQLSYIKKLRIISRTSMEKVAEQGMEVREIGSHLGVTHVLEGSVRRAGDQVRVTVQLIDAATDEHVWADNFDRKLDDIFAIQSEIAEQIAAQLKTELTPEEIQQIEQVPTTSNEAYDLFVKARELNRVWLGADNFKDMLPLLEQAIELDPDFLKAQVMLVEVYGRLVWTSSDPTGEYKIKAKETLSSIQTKHPDSIEAAIALGHYLYTVERDYAGTIEAMEKVLLARPHDVEVLLHIGIAYRRLNNFTQGLPLIQKAASLDPEHAAIAGELGFHLEGAGLYEQARATHKLSVSKFPDDVFAKLGLARVELLHFGNLENYLSLKQQVSQKLGFKDGSVVGEVGMFKSPSTIDKTISAFDEINKSVSIYRARANDVVVASLLNTAGREQESQERAKLVLDFYYKNLGSLENFIAHRKKGFYADMSYAACLADDQEAFKRFEAIMHSHKAYEIYEGNKSYALAIAECGDVQGAWKLLFSEANSAGLTAVTPWLLALDQTYQHYFSELPEYQKMVAELEASKESKN